MFLDLLAAEPNDRRRDLQRGPIFRGSHGKVCSCSHDVSRPEHRVDDLQPQGAVQRIQAGCFAQHPERFFRPIDSVKHRGNRLELLGRDGILPSRRRVPGRNIELEKPRAEITVVRLDRTRLSERLDGLRRRPRSACASAISLSSRTAPGTSSRSARARAPARRASRSSGSSEPTRTSSSAAPRRSPRRRHRSARLSNDPRASATWPSLAAISAAWSCAYAASGFILRTFL